MTALKLGTQESGNPESWDPTYLKYKFSKSKSVSPKMSARSELVGKNSTWPHLGPSQANFSMGQKHAKNMLQLLPIFLGGPMGPIHPVWGHLV